MNRTMINIAASTLVMGLGTALCMSGSALARPDSRASQSGPVQEAMKLQSEALRSVQQGQFAEALVSIERAVELSPRDVGFRLLLADIYLKTGRFESARATYGDVIELDPAHVRAGLRYALMQIALGRPQGAVAQLDSLAGRAPAADVGLAFALAGYPDRAVELLESAARSHDATPRLRQNLALSYALAGQWARARAVASQDISPAEVNGRLEQWAALAKPGAQSAQVASLLGVNPVADPGQPVRLTLVAPDRAPAGPVTGEAFASAAPLTSSTVFEASSGTIAPPQAASSPGEAQDDPAWWPAPSSAPLLAEADQSESLEVPTASPVGRDEVEVRFAAAAETLTRPHRAVISNASEARPIAPVFRAQAPAEVRTAPDGRFVVQLGAFSNEANAERAWQNAERSYGLGRHQPTTTTIDIGKRTLHRVSVSSFASAIDAGRLCSVIRSRGGECFVRVNAGDAAIRWAARYSPDRSQQA